MVEREWGVFIKGAWNYLAMWLAVSVEMKMRVDTCPIVHILPSFTQVSFMDHRT